MKAFSGSEPWGSVRPLAKIVLCAVLALLSSAAAQDMQAAQELMDLTQQMKSADDPCPYLPQIRAKMNQMANSDPDVYEALKPSLDDINAMDLRCNTSATTNSAANASPDASASQPEASTATPPAPPTPTDVRYTAGGTRMLTDDEYDQLRQGLHYDPATAVLNVGGTAASNLVDGTGAILATVAVQWIKTEGTSGPAPLARFRGTLTNRSNCLFSSDAVMVLPNQPDDVWGVNSGTWLTWVTPNEPLPGQSKTFLGNATLRSAYSTFVFKPLDAEHALTQCRTAKPLTPALDTNE